MSSVPTEAELLKAKPILFNTEMVRAILDGKKTSTRRVVKIPDEWSYDGVGKIKSAHAKKNKLGAIIRKGIDTDFPEVDLVASRYEVGDILYVRETFCIGKYESIYIGEGCGEPIGIFQSSSDTNIIYYADAIEICDFSDLDKEDLPRWKPSIHMPKKYARIFLKVVSVKVERLQDITAGGIKEEGFNKDTSTFEVEGYTHETVVRHALVAWWKTLWDSTAPEKYKWEDNPYVFVYEFEEIKGTAC